MVMVIRLRCLPMAQSMLGEEMSTVNLVTESLLLIPLSPLPSKPPVRQ